MSSNPEVGFLRHILEGRRKGEYFIIKYINGGNDGGLPVTLDHAPATHSSLGDGTVFSAPVARLRTRIAETNDISTNSISAYPR